MDTLDALALIGEVVSIVGVGVALPLLLGIAIARAIDGDWVETEIVVLDDLDPVHARWSAGAEVHGRDLHDWEAERLEGSIVHRAFTSRRRPDRMRLDRHRHELRALSLASVILLAIAALGFALSLLPYFAP